MGMIGNYISAEKEEIQKILIGELSVYDLEEGSSDTVQFQTMDIDKSWQGIHFLLCNNIKNGEPPLGYVVPMVLEADVTEACECEFGAFHLNTIQITSCYDKIKDFTKDELLKMYDFSSMKEADIYPDVKNEDEEDFFMYISENFMSIKEFYKKAIDLNLEVIFYIS